VRLSAIIQRVFVWITGTYRAINSKHVPPYLAEFECRFNRRYDLAAIIPRLTWPPS
jgi:transposase-like protein